MKTKLSCNVNSCVNNVASGMCSAERIVIEGNSAKSSEETKCGTFACENFANAVASIANTNYVGEVVQAFNESEIKMSPHIKCEASNCTFWDNELCTASNVQIFGDENAENSSATRCESFVPR